MTRLIDWWHGWRTYRRDMKYGDYCGKARHWWQRDVPFGSAPR